MCVLTVGEPSFVHRGIVHIHCHGNRGYIQLTIKRSIVVCSVLFLALPDVWLLSCPTCAVQYRIMID